MQRKFDDLILLDEVGFRLYAIFVDTLTLHYLHAVNSYTLFGFISSYNFSTLVSSERCFFSKGFFYKPSDFLISSFPSYIYSIILFITG